MAQKRHIRVRVSDLRVEALQELCTDILDTFKPTNDHQYLLREYMRELQHTLASMKRRPQGEYTLSLSGTEAVAFNQLWKMVDISHDKYANVIVENMMKKINSLAA